MITAEFYYKQSKLCGFMIKGHAGYAENGNDIVCASVSSAVQLVCNIITESFKVNADIKVLIDKIQLILPFADENSQKVLDGLYTHIKFLSEDYKGTIKITTSEV